VAAAAHRWKPPASPERDVLRGLLATTLRVDVLAVLLRMPEECFCEVLLGTVAQLVELLAAVDATGPVTAILPPPSEQPEQPLPAAQPAGRWRSAWPAGALTAL